MQRRRGTAGGLGFALAAGLGMSIAQAQAPVLPQSTFGQSSPNTTSLGKIPGSGANSDLSAGGGTDEILGGHPGVSVGRTRRQPRATLSPLTASQGIRPREVREAGAPAAAPMSLPRVFGDEGPPNGLTLDDAITRLVRENLDLRGQFYEIPQAEADILTASLRANPVFYADSQLIPYGQYSATRPGGPVQYDVNVNYPLDLSHKRQARTDVACRIKRTLEAQYQDAVRIQIGNLYNAFVDLLAARETVRFARENLAGLEPILRETETLTRRGLKSPADVDRLRVQRNTASIGVADAEDTLRDAQGALGPLLNLPDEQLESLQIRGLLYDSAPPPPAEATLVAMALAGRPDVVALRLGIGRAVADVDLARANRYEDVYVLYQPYTFQNNAPFNAKSAHSWALGVTVPLPIYNRNQGNIRRAELNVAQTQVEMAALERRVANEVKRASREYAISKVAVGRIERELLPSAREFLQEKAALLPKGELEVVEFLDAQRDYNDVVRQYRDAIVRHRRSMLDLNTAVGRRVLP